MKKLLVIIIIFVFSSAAFAETYGNVKVDKVVSVYAGDTFMCSIKAWPKIVGKNINVRIKHIDTPEMKCKKSYSDAECKKLKALARTARGLTANLLKRAKVIELRNIERGKYFRILADVYVDDRNLAEILIKNKLAIYYDGGTKKDWLDVRLTGSQSMVSPDMSQPKKVNKLPLKFRHSSLQTGLRLNRVAVKKVIKGHMGEIKLCYENVLTSKQYFQGKIVFEWDIIKTGDVGAINVLSTTIRDADFIACIKSKIANWKFPKPRNGKSIISYPFVFDGHVIK